LYFSPLVFILIVSNFKLRKLFVFKVFSFATLQKQDSSILKFLKLEKIFLFNGNFFSQKFHLISHPKNTVFWRSQILQKFGIKPCLSPKSYLIQKTEFFGQGRDKIFAKFGTGTRFK